MGIGQVQHGAHGTAGLRCELCSLMVNVAWFVSWSKPIPIEYAVLRLCYEF